LDQALVLCRLLHFTAAFLLFGASAFLWAIAPPEAVGRLAKRLWPVMGLSLFVIACTAIGWLLLAAGEMGEGWGDTLNVSVVQNVLLGTAFGRVWQFRLGFIFLLIAVAALSRRQPWRNMALAGALVLGSLGFVGHAAMEADMTALPHELNHAVHLLSAGFWLGGLVPLLLLLLQGSYSRNLDSSAWTALSRFSGAGHFAVALVLATGAINTWLIIGGWPVNLDSTYQLLLCTKIMLVLTMVGLAIINRYAFVPLIGNGRWPLKLLCWNTIGEISLGFAVIGLVSYFAMVEPS
jgi:putative copper resistance protein D